MLRLVVTATPHDAAAAIAAFIVDALERAPDMVLGLPTGRTPLLLYDALADLSRRRRADFSRAVTFNLDEFWGLAANDPRNYRTFMERHFFSRVNVLPSRAHIPDGAARNWRLAAARYDDLIAQAGGLDVCLVGLGANGHLAFNEPGASLRAETHRARLTPATRQANAHLFGGRLRDVPSHGLTMGMGAILGARAVILLATGRGKASIVRRALTGPLTTRVPASLLRAHPNALAVLDRDAARLLP